LSQQEIAQLEAVMNKHGIKLNVLLVSTIGAQDAGSYSESIFTSWNLTNDEGLLLVADQDGIVWLQLGIGSVMENAIYAASDLKGSNPVLAFLEKTFYPEAGMNNYY